MLAPTLYQRRTEMLLRNGLPPGATVTDVTSGFATLHVAGPKSRAVLGALTDQDLSNEAFPFLSAREIDLGWAKALALRVSFTGELGWELLVPTEFAADVYDKVVAAGAPHGMRHAGAFAFDGLRLERGFRSWGHDIGALDDPYAVGLGFAVRSDKEDFVGKEALAALKERTARSGAREREARRPGADALARRAGRDGQGADRIRDERRLRPSSRRRRRARVGARRARRRPSRLGRGPRHEGARDDQPRAVLRPEGRPPRAPDQRVREAPQRTCTPPAPKPLHLLQEGLASKPIRRWATSRQMSYIRCGVITVSFSSTWIARPSVIALNCTATSSASCPSVGNSPVWRP